MNVNEKEFQITLPSNASCSYFPENLATNYNTRLVHPLDLQGEWEVAVMDIQYPCSWNNIANDTMVAFAAVPVDEAKFEDAFPALPVQGDVMREQFQAHLVRTLAMRAKSEDYNRYSVERDNTRVLIRSGRIPHKYFNSNADICAWLVQLFNKKMSGLGQGAQMGYVYEESTEKVTLYFEKTKKVEIWTNNSALFDMLGFTEYEKTNTNFAPVNDDGKVDRQPTQVYTLYHPFKSNKPARFPSIQSLFIYSDIIEPQMVGDTKATLLGVAPVEYQAEKVNYWPFNPPYYIPLAKTCFETIEILICNDRGNPVDFAPNAKVVCRLHFRRHHNIF